MSHDHEPGDSAAPRRSSPGLRVGQTIYTNSAAKFWPWLVTDLATTYPTATHVVLTTLTDLALSPDLLDPQRSLQRLIDITCQGHDVGSPEDTLAELEILGGPGVVRIQVRDTREQTLLHEGLQDMLDAETFCCLMVWMLEWAAIPHAQWREGDLRGRVEGCRLLDSTPFQVTFSTQHRHVREGLYEREVVLEL